MGESIDLLCWGAPPAGRSEPLDVGSTIVLPDRLADAAAVVADHLAADPSPWLLFWDHRLGPVPAQAVHDAITGPVGDVWHGGLDLGTAGQPDEHDYIHPSTPFVLDPPAERGGTCWRLSLASALVRTDALRAVGGIDPAFHGGFGAGLELGRRLIERGAVIRAAPWLVPAPGLLPEPMDEHDRFLFLRRVFGRKWVDYAAFRRALATRRPLRVLRGHRSSRSTAAQQPAVRPGIIERAPVEVPVDARVSVVLPTLGRYELLAPLLEQLVEQTVRPIEVLVIDQNDPDKRDHELYRRFADRGVRVIWQDVRGQWISRNAAVLEAKGEWIAFIDDDSEIESDFLAQHLEGLRRYDADLSTGASLAVVGAPTPENYAFFRVADQWDSGNGMCHRDLFVRLGLFDQQFDRQRRGDAEFGLRTQLAGGLVIHNPHAIRIHLKAEEGGLRTYGSWDGFRHKDRSKPLPLPSMLYYSARFHTPRQQREDLALGLVNGIVPYHLKRRTSPAQWGLLLASEVVHIPSTVRRVRESKRLAAAMVAEGPKIPVLPE